MALFTISVWKSLSQIIMARCYHLCVERDLWSPQKAGHLRQRCVRLQEVVGTSMKNETKAQIEKNPSLLLIGV